jgi:hypothetical protein
MKKILIAVLLLSNTVFAQTKDNSANQFKYRFGVKIAPNVAWLKSDDKLLTNDKATVNFSYGLTFDYRLSKSKTFMFTTGFDVTNINSKSTINKVLSFTNPKYNATDISSTKDLTSNSTKYSNKLKYLEIPLLFSGRTKEIGYMTYFFQAGFTPSFLLNQKAYITPDNSKIAIDGKVLLNSDLKEDYVTKQDDIAMLRMGYILGAGAEYNLQGTTSLIGSIRFNNGLFNIMKDPNKEFQKVKNSYISLNIGIVF